MQKVGFFKIHDWKRYINGEGDLQEVRDQTPHLVLEFINPLSRLELDRLVTLLNKGYNYPNSIAVWDENNKWEVIL